MHLLTTCLCKSPRACASLAMITLSLAFGMHINFVAPYIPYVATNDHCANYGTAHSCTAASFTQCRWFANISRCDFADANCSAFATRAACGTATSSCDWDTTAKQCQHFVGLSVLDITIFATVGIVAATLGSLVGGECYDVVGSRLTLVLAGGLNLAAGLFYHVGRGTNVFALVVVGRTLHGFAAGICIGIVARYVSFVLSPEVASSLRAPLATEEPPAPSAAPFDLPLAQVDKELRKGDVRALELLLQFVQAVVSAGIVVNLIYGAAAFPRPLPSAPPLEMEWRLHAYMLMTILLGMAILLLACLLPSAPSRSERDAIRTSGRADDIPMTPIGPGKVGLWIVPQLGRMALLGAAMHLGGIQVLVLFGPGLLQQALPPGMDSLTTNLILQTVLLGVTLFAPLLAFVHPKTAVLAGVAVSIVGDSIAGGFMLTQSGSDGVAGTLIGVLLVGVGFQLVAVAFTPASIACFPRAVHKYSIPVTQSLSGFFSLLVSASYLPVIEAIPLDTTTQAQGAAFFGFAVLSIIVGMLLLIFLERGDEV